MHPTLAAFARRHGLAEHVLAELDTLIGSGFGVAASVLDAYESVDLEPWGSEEETEERPRVAERYEDLGPIGHGGMAEAVGVRSAGVMPRLVLCGTTRAIAQTT